MNRNNTIGPISSTVEDASIFHVWAKHTAHGSTGTIVVSLHSAAHLGTDAIDGPAVFIDHHDPHRDEITDRQQLDALIDALTAVRNDWDALTAADSSPAASTPSGYVRSLARRFQRPI